MGKRTNYVAMATALGLVALTGCAVGGGGSAGKSSDGDVTLSLLTFETPNLTTSYWDDIIAKTSAKVPGVKIKKLVAPSAEQRNEYARQLDSTSALPDIMVAIDPAGLAEAGKSSPPCWPRCRPTISSGRIAGGAVPSSVSC